MAVIVTGDQGVTSHLMQSGWMPQMIVVAANRKYVFRFVASSI